MLISRDKKLGQILLFLGLLIMVSMIINNNYLRLVVSILEIIITVVCGVILLSGDKELK